MHNHENHILTLGIHSSLRAICVLFSCVNSDCVKILLDDDDSVKDITINDVSIEKDGLPKVITFQNFVYQASFTRRMELHAKSTIFPEECRVYLAKRFNLTNNC